LTRICNTCCMLIHLSIIKYCCCQEPTPLPTPPPTSQSTPLPTPPPTSPQPTQQCEACGSAASKQADYCGTKATTVSGRTCQAWASDFPHDHSFNDLEANYCRNPDNEGCGAWCYTTDPNKRWECCNVPDCPPPVS